MPRVIHNPQSTREVTVLDIVGELDDGVQDITEALETAVLGTAHVVLNVERVGFMNSAAHGAIYSAHQAMAQNGRRLVIVNAQDQVLRVAQTLGLNQVVRFVTDTTDNLTALAFTQ